MSSLKELRWGKHPAPVAEAGRRLAAALLQSASALLARLAVSLASEPAPASESPRAHFVRCPPRGRRRPWGGPAGAESDPRFEFHAEAGAPEGALYMDGRFVGWLPGVSRL